MTLSIIGHGYVGLVTAAVFADLGNTVFCLGRTKKKIDNLKKGLMPFYEPGLEELVKRNTKAGRLRFTLSYAEAISPSKVIFICVGTPSKANGEADLSQVFKSVDSIADYLSKDSIVACKSTVPVGTNLMIKNRLNNKKIDIASCPEFLREGTAISDTLRPDRVVIGSENKKVENLLLELHKPINGSRVLVSIREAEIIKYLSNAFLATKISFANAAAYICDRLNIDVQMVLDGVGQDKRIGRAFLYPGIGYGGSCFPKDVKSLIAQAGKVGYNFTLLKSVEKVNEEAVNHYFDIIIKQVKKGSKVGILGLAFKPETDDMRDAPSLKIINRLQEKGYKIKAYDPQARRNAQNILTKVNFVDSSYEAARGASALLALTEWNEFRQLDLLKIKKLMKKPVILDGRNIFDPLIVKNLGFSYYGIGRG